MRLVDVRLLFTVLLLPALSSGQVPEIGVIDFYGVRNVPESRLRESLGVKEGEPLPRSKGDVEDALEQVSGIVRARVEATCCEDGKAILYVGVEEKGAPTFEFRSAPADPVVLPAEIHETYVRFLACLSEAVRERDTAEDLTNGHSLMANASCRAHQETFLVYADKHLSVLRDALRNSFDEEHRAIAAYVIGYAADKKKVVDDLLYAVRDPDETVRSNAMRALAAVEVLASRRPTLGIRIPPTWLVEMLNSLVWTDRTTAAVNLVNLTETRDSEVLSQLRERALLALVDMAKWTHLPHALPSFILLGRVAAMPEEDIQDAWAKGERERVIEEGTKLLVPAKGSGKKK
ncbi:MAG: HEAT repeat domain-containing protein [Bryobacteraceae bacterium]|nr:HEAT repeat domain-containing protein [Bryobacteraceae bacterium]